nr:uncharacterized mitochondrial protein AtMg00810-like [Nicotiana tomentosiformis]
MSNLQWFYLSPTCFQYYNHSINPSTHLSHQALIPVTQNWFPDSDVTHHITPDLSNFNQYEENKGHDQLQLVNGQGLAIHNTVYVGDIVVTGNNIKFLESVVDQLDNSFSIRDLYNLSFFLGVQVSRNSSGIYLSQEQYINILLDIDSMQNCKPLLTPMAVTVKLFKGDTPEFRDPTLYRHVAVKRVLRYLQHTKKQQFFFSRSSHLHLQAFTDADWADCTDDRKSTGGYVIFLGNNLISWSSKKQHTVARSSIESAKTKLNYYK